MSNWPHPWKPTEATVNKVYDVLAGLPGNSFTYERLAMATGLSERTCHFAIRLLEFEERIYLQRRKGRATLFTLEAVE